MGNGDRGAVDPPRRCRNGAEKSGKTPGNYGIFCSFAVPHFDASAGKARPPEHEHAAAMGVARRSFVTREFLIDMANYR